MPKTRISGLVAIAAIALSATDILPITDTAVPKTNKVTMAQLRTALLTGGAGYAADSLALSGAGVGLSIDKTAAASLLAMLNVKRSGTSLYWLGSDASDNGAILTADAATANLTWTNAGNFTTRGSLNIGDTSGFAIGNVPDRRRIVTTGPSAFLLGGDDNGFADLSLGGMTMAGTLSTPAIVVTGGRVQFGGTTASFPALKRNATALEARLADDSAYTVLRVSGLNADFVNMSVFTGTAKILGGTVGISLRNNADGADNLLISDAGVVSSRSHLSSGGDLIAAAGSSHLWSGRSLMKSPSDGSITLTNNAGTAFTLLQLGGTTSGFPAFKRNAAAVDLRLADDSAFADLSVSSLYASSKIVYLGSTSTFSAAVLDLQGTTVGTSATAISSAATGSGGGICIVRGTDGSNRFTDLVFYTSTTADAVLSKNPVGSPALRAYTTNGAGLLRLAMASGSYTVACGELRAITVA